MRNGPLSISVIVPVYNGDATLERCLASLLAALLVSGRPPSELIVVDDGSTDGSGAIARRYGATLVSMEARSGPARARNQGAAAARGEILVFLDADVCVHADTLARLAAHFEKADPPAAAIGSYDDAPAARNFISQFKNLMHCFVHQNAREQACTFWAGCGAIRRTAFVEAGGFNERYRRASIEDIELGYRLVAGGRRIVLDRHVLCTHLKRWTLAGLLRTDIFDRALPWTRLIVESRRLPDDLNVRWSQRISGALAVVMAGWVTAGWWVLPVLPVVAGTAVLWLSIIALNFRFYRFLREKRGVRFAALAAPLHLGYLIYSTAAFLGGSAYYTLLERSKPTKDVCAAEADR